MSPHLDLPFPALAGLLGTLPPTQFFNEWWERAPGLLTATSPEEREAFRGQDWHELSHAALTRDIAVEVLQAGRPRKPQSTAEIDDAFNAGASIRVIRVQRVWPALERLCADLQRELGFKVNANLYVTPETRQGLDIHADSHDVIVVQVAGGKDWEIFGSPYKLPVDYRAPLVFEDGTHRDHRGDAFGGRGYKGEEVGPRLIGCSLAPGDLLYIPRGFVHKAVASRGTSVHVTIGLHSTTWGDLLALAVAQESRTEALLRETLPPGATRVAASRDFVEAELRRRGGRLFERLHGEALMLETASRFLAAGKPPNPPVTDGDGGAEQPAAPASEPPGNPQAPTFDPTLRYALTQQAYVSFGPQAIDVRSLRAPGTVHTFPASFRPLFDELVQGAFISPQLAPPLTPRSGEVLVRRLFEAGIVTPAL